MGTLRRSCSKVYELSEVRFGLMYGVGQGIAVLDGGPRRARGRGGLGFCSYFADRSILEPECAVHRPAEPA